MFYLSKELTSGKVLRSQETYDDYWDATAAAFDAWRNGITKTVAVMRAGKVVSITECGRFMEMYRPQLTERKDP